MIYVVNMNITKGFVFVLSLSILRELRLSKGNPEGEKERNCIRKIEDQHCLMTNYVKKRSPELIYMETFSNVNKCRRFSDIICC